MPSLNDINSGIVSSFSAVNIMSILGWIVFGVICVGGGWVFYIWNKNKKIFNKKITAFEIVGQYWSPTIRDVARTVKLGKGGFEILYLKKLKVWKIAYGGRVGKDTYYFYIMPDGYWYNGMMSANLHKIDEDNGLVPIVTTNPLMRGQYTALEKQIDALSGDKKSFMEKYGAWVMMGVFILIIGVFTWLDFKEISNVAGQLVEVSKDLGKMIQLSGGQIGSSSNPINSTGVFPA